MKFSFQHLDDVNEGYFKHMKSALGISFRMAKGSIMVLIHAVLPCFFTNNASNICRDIVKLVDNKKLLANS